MNNLIVDKKNGTVHFWQNHTYYGTEINETYEYIEPVLHIGNSNERYSINCIDKSSNTKIYIETPVNNTVLIIKDYVDY
jgi:hypothetical protein